jgi:hypothetical protein
VRAQLAPPKREPAPLDKPAPTEPGVLQRERAKPAAAWSPHTAAAQLAPRTRPARVDAPAQANRTLAEAPTLAPESAAAPSQASAPELTLLSRAQRLLAQDPRAALDVIDEHVRAYPAGAFVEEREALAIDALRRLGRRQELQARARAFLQRYPGSPQRERIEAWLR